MVLLPSCGLADKIFNMFVSLFLAAHLIHLSTADVQCLNCNDVLDPTDCNTFQKCLPTERCFIEAFLTSTGDITYDLGCREAAQCDGLMPVIRRHIPEELNRQMSLDMFGNPMVNGSKRSANAAVLCSNCCETSLCNSIGCGSNGYTNNRGPVCANCLNTDSVDSCKTLRVCRQHEVCMLLKTIDSGTHQPKYQTKCEQEQVCNKQFTEYSNIYAMFMGQKFDAISNGGRCSIRCCTTDLCNTQCNSPNNVASPAVESQPVQTLPKPLDVGGLPIVPKVHPAEFVAPPGLHNTHFPKGHNWNPGPAVVTEPSSPHFGSHPHREVYVPNQPDPHGMPIYSVSSESPGILAALGISELPGPMNTSGIVHLKQSTEAPSRWGPSVNAPPAAQSVDRQWRGRSKTATSNNASRTSHQVHESRGITDTPRHFDSNTHSGILSNYVQQGKQESLGITMTSAQNIERALNSGIQRIYDSGAVNKGPQERMTNHHREAQMHVDSQHHIRPQNKPIHSGPNYIPDQQLNAEAQFLSQPEQQSTHTSNTAQSKPNLDPTRDATRISGTNRQQVDPHRPFDQNASLNRANVNSQRSYDQQALNSGSRNPNNMNSHKSFDQHAANLGPTNPSNMNSQQPFDQQASNSGSRNPNKMNSQQPYDQQASNSGSRNPNNMNSQQPFDQQASNSGSRNPNNMNSHKSFNQHLANSGSRNPNNMNSQQPYDQHVSNLGPTNPNNMNSQQPYNQQVSNLGPTNPNNMNSQQPFDQQASNLGPTNPNNMNSQQPYDQQASNLGPTNPDIMNSQQPYDQQASNSGSRNPNNMNSQQPYDQQASNLGPTNPNNMNSQQPYDQQASNLGPIKPNNMNSQQSYDQQASNLGQTNPNNMNSQQPYDQQASNSGSRNPNKMNSQQPYDQHAPNSALRNPEIMNPRSRYNAEQQTSNVHNIVSNKSSISSAHYPEANYASEPQTGSLGARDSRGQNRIPKQHINSNIDFLTESQRNRVAQVMTSNRKADTHGNFDMLTDAQRKRVAQVMNSNRQANTHASITTTQRSSGSGFDAPRNVLNYPNSQAQSEHLPSTTERISNANRMQHRSHISQPGSSQGANKKPQMRNKPQRNVDMYQRNAEWNIKASPVNALVGGSNRIDHGSISNTNELHTKRVMHDKPGLLNANENAFTARNSESPWVQKKNVNSRDGKKYQNSIPRNIDPRGQLNSRQNMIDSTQQNANQNGPSASFNAKALESLRSQRLAVDSMRKSNNNPGQQHQTNSRTKQNVPYIPAAPSYIESTSQANMQQMADPRSIVGSARVVGGPGGMALPELLHPSRNQPPQGIMNVQRITEVPTFSEPFQSYPQQTLDGPRPMDLGSFGPPAMHLDANRGHNVEQKYPVTSAPVLTTPTTVYVPPTTTVHPCIHNPCVRGTCFEKVGSYKCKCEPGSWGKDCEQSLLVSSPPNITVTTKKYKLPTTTPDIDPCFSNPCMRGKCSFYHKTYRCACDYGFYGRDCEKVSLGGAAFLGALGLNIDACQAQAQPCVNGNCTTANNKVACTCEPGFTGTTCSEVLDHCSSLPCVRGSCNNGTFGFECVCPPGFTGIHCEAIDYCATTPCRQGTCSNTANGYVCNCAPGYTGSQCEVIDHCSSSPCVRGRCTNRQNEFSCSCPAGYIGKQCEAVDFCFPSPCVHGNCINSNTGYKCSCPKGFIGAQCQVVDHCASRPCVRGNCENSDTTYMCICPLGYMGNQCQTVDYCASKPCAHGRCINGDADYQCQCPYAYTGKQCQTVNHCSSSPCARGTCKNSNSGYTCECPVGYTGPQCRTIDHCHSTPCASGTCLNSNTGYTCILSSGYIGSHLQGNNAAVDHCASSPCVQGSCVSGNTGFVCHCPNGYFGVQCEIYVPNQSSSIPPRLAEYHYSPPQNNAAFQHPKHPKHPQAPDNCSPSPCVRGTCVSSDVGFQCFCPPAFTGLLCETTDLCASSPCLRGQCISNELGFQCNCPPGFLGAVCEATDHCASYPCVQGTCVSSDLGFQCNCPHGIIGTLCDAADPCAAAPCIRGQCVHTNTGYQCNCPMGYTGLHCELADPCAATPCVRGQCVGTNTGYQCNCPAGYTGLNCEILDHCASSPCNNGTCVSSDVGFKCNCLPGFAGKRCDITDHCVPPPCQRGKCMSTDVGFKCSCKPGFTGQRCDKPDKCASSPCRRGTCVSSDLGFMCTCPAGFTGSRCEKTDHCASFPCQRGDCVNTDVGFKCNCPQAYSGVHCEYQDHCASFPCVRGTCNNTAIGFLCTCPNRYTGAHCEVELFRPTDYCASRPCVRGSCVNGDMDFLCSCPPGFTGVHCEINTFSAPDHCASYPCVRGTCVNSDVGFKCTCPPRFNGVRCEVDVFAPAHDHCASMPCIQGTCVSNAVGYQCNCPTGFSGLRCEVEDMCANNLCSFGTCVASATSYTCECYAGYSGMNCDIPGGSYCERNHGVYALCGHGTCASVGSGYECICDPRYNGTHCLFQYECFGGHVCFHDGTCVNKRSCSCRAGYTGNHCGTISSYEALQLKPGDIVTRGKDWSYGNQDGGLHSVGKVISINGMWVNVMWVNGDKYHYTMAYGKYDLELAP